MTDNPGRIVSDFLNAFHTGETEIARRMVRDDFVFRAPLLENAGGVEGYFGGAERKARCTRSFRILHQWDDRGEVSTFYELDLGLPDDHAQLRVFEWHSVNEGKIASSHMVFDSNAPAVSAMRTALPSLA